MDVPYRPGVRGVVRLAALVAAALVLLVAPPGDAAGAHAYLTDTVPTAGTALAGSPTEVVLTYDGPVTPAGNALTVIDEAGNERRLDAEEGRDAGQIRAAMGGELGPGVHRVVWRVLPADGHVLEGDFTFTMTTDASSVDTAAPTPAELGPTTPERSPGPTWSGDTVAGKASELAATQRMEDVGTVASDGNWAGALALLAAVGVVAVGLVRRGRRGVTEIAR